MSFAVNEPRRAGNRQPQKIHQGLVPDTCWNNWKDFHWLQWALVPFLIAPPCVSQGFESRKLRVLCLCTHSSLMSFLCQGSGETGWMPAALWSSGYISHGPQGLSFPQGKDVDNDNCFLKKNAWGLLICCIEELVVSMVSLSDCTVRWARPKWVCLLSGQPHWWTPESPPVVAARIRPLLGQMRLSLAKVPLWCEQPVFRIRS